MKKIYIAGPDVFDVESIKIGKKIVSLCSKYGYEGLYPLDNVVDIKQSKNKIAQDIYEANVAMIDQADIVIANLSSFRGKESDSGTVWECGYAHALGKKVYGYLNRSGEYKDQFSLKSKSNEYFLDEDGLVIEDFGHSVNLMIANSCIDICYGNFEDILKLISLDHR